MQTGGTSIVAKPFWRRASRSKAIGSNIDGASGYLLSKIDRNSRISFWTRAAAASPFARPIAWESVFSRKQGDFPRKTGRRLSTNGQSLRVIRDLDNFFKSK